MEFQVLSPNMRKCEFPVIIFQVGDGTTSVTLLAAEFLKQVKPYVEEGLHPQIIIRAFRTATQLVWEYWLPSALCLGTFMFLLG